MISSSDIDRLSYISIFLEPLTQHPNCKTIECGPATGFIVKRNGFKFLVTNYHVLSGRKSTDNSVISDTGGIPTHLKCTFHGKKIGTWVSKVLPLYSEENKPTWVTFQVIDSDCFKYSDIGILPLPEMNDVSHYEVNMDESVNLRTSPCCCATILGYPGGRKSYEYFPIWVTGYIASEPNLAYANLPIFLVNATTTSGMSGSPVFQVADGNYFDNVGNYYLDGERKYKFLGIYSGRITKNQQLLSDIATIDHQDNKINPLNIGIVWKPSIIYHIIDLILKNSNQIVFH